jgi:haloacetate dehalogenase
MAEDMATLIKHLGHEQFAVAGHDRGSYVAFRLAMDHPDVVSRVALLDSVPIVEHLERCDARFAAAWWHWFFFAQLDKPERAINADPDAWYATTADTMGAEAYEEFRQAIHDPDTVHAMLEDYRAGLGIDREHEEADRAAGRTIACPALVLWSTKDDLEELFGDPLLIWRSWADDVHGHGIESGHHVAEEAPEQLAAALRDFFAE